METKNKDTAFWIFSAVLWLCAIAIWLVAVDRDLPNYGMRLLYKSTWALLAGVMLEWIVAAACIRERRGKDLRVVVLIALTMASVFLLPFGLAKWVWRPSYPEYQYVVNPLWFYSENLLLSLLIHASPFLVVAIGHYSASIGDAPVDFKPMDSMPEPVFKRKESWLDHVWDGTAGTFDYYGMHGEFDRNDESRRMSEEIQQFHQAHPDADLSEHFFWDDILDAKTDGYLDEDS